MSRDIETKVIGVFALVPPMSVFCDADACIIAGSELSMKKYLSSKPDASIKFQIKRTRFGEILQGLNMGGAYAFDQESYNRFYPLANKYGFNLKEENFSVPTETGRHFVVIRNDANT